MIKLFALAFGAYILPVLAYFLGLFLLRLFGNQYNHQPPWMVLSFIGIIFALISLIAFSQSDGGDPSWRYQPGSLEGDTVTPGYFIKPDGTRVYDHE